MLTFSREISSVVPLEGSDQLCMIATTLLGLEHLLPPEVESETELQTLDVVNKSYTR